MKFQFDMNQFTTSKFWSQAFTEFFGTIFWITIANQGGGSPWSWAISYVVITSAFPSHLNSAITVMTMAEDKFLDPLKGLVWIGMQCLGAFVAFHVGAALGFAQDSSAGFAIADWKAGLREFLAVMVFLWMFCDGTRKAENGMPKSVFLTLAIVVSFWLGGEGFVFSWNRAFTSMEGAAGFWVAALWSVLASVVVCFKWNWWNGTCDGDAASQASEQAKEKIVEQEEA